MACLPARSKGLLFPGQLCGRACTRGVFVSCPSELSPPALALALPGPMVPWVTQGQGCCRRPQLLQGLLLVVQAWGVPPSALPWAPAAHTVRQ